MTNNFLINNFQHLTTTPENVEQLKKLVLQMAVQGKLTAKWREDVKTQGLASPNDPNYNAHALLEKIKTEKEQLIKEGKIRRQKSLPTITDEEKPYDLPDCWNWERLGNIGLGFEYGTSSKSTSVGEVPVLRMGNIQDGKIIWNSLVFSSNESDNLTYLLQEHDLLFNRTNSRELVGKTALFSSDRKAIFAGYLVRFRMLDEISSSYTNYVMNSPLHRNWCDEVKTDAIGQSNINATKLKSFRFPLPPIAEQQAIVSKVEKLFTQIDQLHALAQKRLNYREKSAKALFSKINHAGNDTELQETWQTLTTHFHTLTQSNESVKQLRQSILQMAVQGKLTARWRKENPDVEPVTDLYEKIKVENETIKSKYNLRNQKTLLEISEDEKLFQTPDSWAWFRLGKLLYTTSGGTPTRGNTDYWDGDIPSLKSGELTDGLITMEAGEKITELGHKKSSTNLFPKDTLLIALYGATAGKLGILTYPSTTNQAICGFYANSNIETDYLFYYLWAFRSKILSDSWGQAQPNISQDYLKKFCFALPPHEEQKAIVSKVKQLMAWCDELEKKIEKRDAYQEKMMQAVVKQALKKEAELME